MRTKFAATALVFSLLACVLVAVANGDSISDPAVLSVQSSMEFVAPAEEDALACTFDRAEFDWHLKVEAQGQSLGSLVQVRGGACTIIAGNVHARRKAKTELPAYEGH